MLRPEVVVDTMPAPQRIAPFAHAVSGDVIPAGVPGPGRQIQHSRPSTTST